jgi:preprotein translocase subunit SecF
LIFVLLGLLLFGGETVRYFVLALLVGVIAGVYSSIFIASPLLALLQKKQN